MLGQASGSGWEATLEERYTGQLALPLEKSDQLTLFGGSVDLSAREEELREDMVRQLEMQLSEVEHAIDMLIASQHEGAMDEALGNLEALKSSIAGAIDSARSGNLASLMMMKNGIVAQIDASVQQVSSAVAKGGYESAGAICEMTWSQIEHLQAQHDQMAAEFHRYEAQSHERIEALAAANGVDISAYREIRDELTEEREKAKKRGDRVGMFEADALLASANVDGLRATGATPEEIAKAEQEAEAARQRYLDEVAISARREAEKSGLSGDALKDYVATARDKADADLAADAAEYSARIARESYLTEVEISARKEAEKAGLSGEEMKDYIAAARTKADADMNEETAEISADLANTQATKEEIGRSVKTPTATAYEAAAKEVAAEIAEENKPTDGQTPAVDVVPAVTTIAAVSLDKPAEIKRL